MAYLDALYALLHKCKVRSRRAKGEPTAVAMWKERGARICLIIASQFMEMKVFSLALSGVHWLKDPRTLRQRRSCSSRCAIRATSRRRRCVQPSRGYIFRAETSPWRHTTSRQSLRTRTRCRR